jgi:malate permease and related proteins
MQEMLVFIPAMVLIISAGYLLKRLGFLGLNDVDTLNKLIIYVTLPALIFLTVQKAKLGLALAAMPLFSIAVIVLCLAVAYAAGKLLKLKPSVLGAFLLVAAMGNTGYLGFPLTIGLLGQSSLVRAVFYDFGTVTMMFTAGIFIAKKFGESKGKTSVFIEFITFPSVIALLAGLAANPLPLPGFLGTALNYLGLATVPLIMLTVGLTLEGKRIGSYAWPLVGVLLIKLLLSPVFALLAAKTGGLSSAPLHVVVLEASMPAAMLSLVVGLKHKLDTEFTSLAILISIIASLVTIPIIQVAVRLLAA